MKRSIKLSILFLLLACSVQAQQKPEEPIAIDIGNSQRVVSGYVSVKCNDEGFTSEACKAELARAYYLGRPLDTKPAKYQAYTPPPGNPYKNHEGRARRKGETKEEFERRTVREQCLGTGERQREP